MFICLEVFAVTFILFINYLMFLNTDIVLCVIGLQNNKLNHG